MIEITRLTSSTGPLTKRIGLSEAGALVSDGSACLMTRGTAERLSLKSLEAFAQHLDQLAPNQAIALGALRPDLDGEVEITTQRRLSEMNGTAPRNLIARTADHIAYRPDHSSLCLIDIDTKGMPDPVAAEIKENGGFWASLVSVIPDLDRVARAVRTSTSSGIARADSGEPLKGSNGVHVFLLVQDGADVERFLRTLHERCWLTGLGWYMVGAGGQMLERSLIDRTVYAAERLVFEAAPILDPALHQDRGKRAPEVTAGETADTRLLCPDLTIVEHSRLKALKAAARAGLAGPAAKARGAFVDAHAARIVERLGCSMPAARHAVERQCAGVLLPGVALPFDADDMEGATVAEVLADPERFVGATLADPLEGPAYGQCKAKVMQRSDGSLWINSFAHGRTKYELKHDAGSVQRALEAGEPDQAPNIIARMLLVADVAADEEQALFELTRRLSGVKARPLAVKIKTTRREAAQNRGKAEAERRLAERTDARLAIPAPEPDDERLPVMKTLDEILGGAPDPVPPMRDLDGHPIEVRTRPPMRLHELTSHGSNQNETPETRLPPPTLPLLTKHNRFSMAHEVERYIEFTVDTKYGPRAVALPGTFVDHFMAYRDSRLPRVGAIITAPLVMPTGELLAPAGLDRERKLVFRIEPELMAIMPSPRACTREKAAVALEFLMDEWLCDVAADFAGKCVLIALALTILERALLPERPAFFITAGKRGGGKTTAIMMVILAVTGKKPAAAAWSPSDEERRKAILAYLAEGLPAMVWDNIPLGTNIACPTLEKVLTAESYSDRELGHTATLTVPSLTVMAFTGNNIGPKGDMSSRSLMARLAVDRIDPENRPFTHADPVAWTTENRGKILKALYTILLANPQLKAATRREMKTRFKTWWHLVGAAIESAAEGLVEKQKTLPVEKRTAATIDFNRLFAAVEVEDEEGAALADVLEILDRIFPGGNTFKSSDIAKLINDPMQGEENDAAALKEAFGEARRGGTGSISAKSVGRRLMTWSGAPTIVGEETLAIERRGDGNKHAISFRVRRL